jgi:hypothetical protein
VNPGLDFCRESSIRTGESLAGEGVGPATYWIFVEDDSVWGAKPPLESGMSDDWKTALSAVSKLIDTKLLLIRRPRRTSAISTAVDARRVIAWRVDCGGGRRVEKRFGNAEAFAGFEWKRELDSAEIVSVDKVELFVCTHGTRDRCCAKWGMPVFDAILPILGDSVWQTSHLGGHRFAATLVAFPLGYSFGRMQPDGVESCVAALRNGRVDALEHLRGRLFLDPFAQVAEIKAIGDEGREPSDFLFFRTTVVQESENESEAEVEIDLRGVTTPSRYKVRRRQVAAMTIGSCGDESARPIQTFEAAKLP